VRYFDGERRRAGLSQDIAALVEQIRPDGITLTLANTSTVHTRRVIVQTGAYGEHQAVSVTVGGKRTAIEAPYFEVRIAPAVAEKLTVTMRRYVNDPTLAFPWDRGWWNDQAAPPARRRPPLSFCRLDGDRPLGTTYSGSVPGPPVQNFEDRLLRRQSPSRNRPCKSA